MTAQEEYIRKIIEIGLKPNEYNNVIIISYTNIDTAKEMFLKLKDEYHIDQMIFLDKDQEKLYNFLKTNPSKEEIEKYVPRMPKLKDPCRTKIIYNYPSYYEDYPKKISKEYRELRSIYDTYDKMYNEEYFLLKKNREQFMITVIPEESWSNHLLGSPDKEDELWELVNRTVPNVDEYREYIKKKLEIKDYLQKSRIKNLTIYTNLGTDFRIGLTGRSLWTCEPEVQRGKEFSYTFPSYEIFTAPDCYSGEGKIVLARPSMFFGEKVTKGEFTFNKGKCINLDTDNEYANKVILNEKNNLNRIGEIAMVSNDSPIARIGKNFDSLILDENAGCHFALGYAIDDSIDLDKPSMLLSGKKKYHFNDSRWHHDFVFGNDSVTVEADLGRNRKILLLENGTWKI